MPYKSADKRREYHRNYLRAWRLRNIESVRAKDREYEKKYRPKRTAAERKSRAENPEKYREKDRRRMMNPQQKLGRRLRSRIYEALKIRQITRSAKTIELIGCSVEFLKGYLEARFVEGMTWDNYGQWHVDHIKPLALFNLIDASQQKAAFHYSNLQPLWALDNMRKHSKYLCDDGLRA